MKIESIVEVIPSVGSISKTDKIINWSHDVFVNAEIFKVLEQEHSHLINKAINSMFKKGWLLRKIYKETDQTQLLFWRIYYGA